MTVRYTMKQSQGFTNTNTVEIARSLGVSLKLAFVELSTSVGKTPTRTDSTSSQIETTGEVKMRTGGRPAKLYRFRREVLLERPAPGVRVKPGKV